MSRGWSHLEELRHDPSLFRRLVLGWIEADFRVQIRILQHFSKSTRKSSSREQIWQMSALKMQKSANVECRSGAKVYESCRSRKILKNAYLDAKIGVDTAENEPNMLMAYALCTSISYLQASTKLGLLNFLRQQ